MYCPQFFHGKNRHANAQQFNVYTYINVFFTYIPFVYVIGNIYLCRNFSWALEMFQKDTRVRVMTLRTGNKP